MSLKGGQILNIISNFARSGATTEEVQELFSLVRPSCNGDFTEEMAQKATAIILAKEKVERSLADDTREWIESATGVFYSSDIAKYLGVSSRQDLKNLSKILNKLEVKQVIQRDGHKNGQWRKVEKSYEEQRWWEATGKPLPYMWVLGVEDYAKIYQGNVVLIEGAKSQGKSTIALEFARLNKHLYPGKRTKYLNVEMSEDELEQRFDRYPQTLMSKGDWKKHVEFIRRTSDWWDLVEPDGLTIVDYLIEYDKSYLIAEYIWRIHQKLKKGIALVIVQRDPRKPYAHGGQRARDIPRLVLSLVNHTITLEDVKSFWPTLTHEVEGKVYPKNPSGLQRKYKQVDWWKLKPDGAWVMAEEEPVQEKGKTWER